MKIPTFPECDHDLVKSLARHSDYELVHRFQKSPTDGKYFTALFCRYSSVVYSLIRHSARSPVQADYLFALTWRHILNELGGIDLSAIRAQRLPGASSESPEKSPDLAQSSQPAAEFSLQAWLISLTAAYVNQAVLPDVESIHYTLKDAPPPLWCYTNRALDVIAPKYRLMILMSQTFEWSETRIAAYLQAEGEQSSAQTVRMELVGARQALEEALPEDVRAIYLKDFLVVAPAAEASGRMTIEFDEADLQV
ncbi:MAG: sigma-70 family RNA polymerase sigma factor [Phormidesmis sp.]